MLFILVDTISVICIFDNYWPPSTRGLKILQLAVCIDLLLVQFGFCIDLMMLQFAAYIDHFKQPFSNRCLNADSKPRDLQTPS